MVPFRFHMFFGVLLEKNPGFDRGGGGGGRSPSLLDSLSYLDIYHPLVQPVCLQSYMGSPKFKLNSL